jgi:GNAT superfamily N-acetyltransferase
MIIRDYKPRDKEKVLGMVEGILQNMFNGDPAGFRLIKEFDVTKDYIKYIVTETLGEEGKIIGTMALRKIDNQTVRLKRMYVRPEYQGQGIAQKMLDNLVKFAKEKGYKRMLLHTYPIMERAMKFYKRNGFVESTGDDPEMIHVEKAL